MKIIKIKKMGGEKYKLKLENGEELILQDQIMIDHNLLFKKEIDEELRLLLAKENAYYEVYHKTVSYIMKKLRSEKEIRNYLEKYQVSKQDVEKMIQKLKDVRLINDELYAKSYVADKLNFTNDGPLKIKHDLEQNQIDEKSIEVALSQIEESFLKDKIIRWCEKKIRLNKKHSTTVLKQKLSADLSRMGYSHDFISECLDQLSFSNSNVIEKEYQKQLHKLSKKYQGKELNYKIKEKLYQKGFPSEEINQILES